MTVRGWFSVLAVALAPWGFAAEPAGAPPEDRCFELRTYYAAPGKFEAMLARFRDHTCKLFERHGMENIGYWAPLENPERKLVYLLAFPNREAAARSWKAFMGDPDWQKAYKESEVNGRLVEKLESVYLKATDYSPRVRSVAAGPRVFELRTYTAAEGRLGALNARFRHHTVKLFEQHGMTNVGYWTPADADKGGSNTLIYLLAHRSKEAAEKSFAAFRADPAWIEARKKSEEAAGGSLTVAGGVKSEFLAPTDFSAMK